MNFFRRLSGLLFRAKAGPKSVTSASKPRAETFGLPFSTDPVGAFGDKPLQPEEIEALRKEVENDTMTERWAEVERMKAARGKFVRLDFK
jgi:hypothetical protein